ncbi:MAG: VOC family protein [Streptosporangiales bacterium]|nr:VOC family protein [Streptosporangiales bacterium]
MHMAVHNITFDCADPYALGTFWSRLLGQPLSADDMPGDPAALVAGPDGAPGLLFLRVPEDKTVKNRVHVDLQPRGRTRDQEVARAVELGAEVCADHRRPDGTGFVVLTDPEGNEFCVERSAAERGSA